MKLADEINIELQKHLRGKQHEFVLPNFYFGGFESDVFSVLRSGYTEEYEIKIAKSDFKKDFSKTEIAERRWNKELGKAETIRQGNKKHDLILQGKRTNRFYFVVPDGLIDVREIPDHAGLIYFKDGLRFNYVKPAKLLHQNKLIMTKRGLLYDIANRCYSRYIHINWKMRMEKINAPD